MVLAVDGRESDYSDDVMPAQGERKSVIYKKRKGFSRADSERILESGGKLSRAELLRCRVRHFSDGVLLGSRKFVNGFYHQLKSAAQSDPNYEGQYEKRDTGARKLRLLDEDKLYSCLLYTSPSPRDQRGSRMPSSA